MNVLIRADASVNIGSGHLMRCLTLAEQLRSAGADVGFACREEAGNMNALLAANGYKTFCLSVGCGNDGQEHDADETRSAASELFPSGVDWLVVDHYQLGSSWERRMRCHASRIMAIDDLADRHHDCDLLLDQNFYANQGERYTGLLPTECTALLGPSYVLFRSEFATARDSLRSRTGVVKRILVFFGGSDPTNQTGNVLEALMEMKLPGVEVDVVVGYSNPNRTRIQEMCARLPGATYHCQVSNMAELIAHSDLGVGAGGSGMWERCYLGLPTVTVVFAENQVRTTEDVAAEGAIRYLGWSDQLSVTDYAFAIQDVISDPQRLLDIEHAALRLMGQQRKSVIDVMFGIHDNNTNGKAKV